METVAAPGADPVAGATSEPAPEPQLVLDAPRATPGLPSGLSMSAVTVQMPRFISADPTRPLPIPGRSEASPTPAPEPGQQAPPQPAPGIRAPGDGPKFQVLDEDRVVILNRYRGLQVLELSNLAEPRTEGELPLNAFGMVALYLAGDHALVLVDGYRQYDRQSGREQQSSALLSIDISRPSRPVLTATALLPGLVRASQLVQRAARAALFVVCDNEAFGAADSSVVMSFDVSAGALTVIRELDLGRRVTAVRTAAETLLVARLPAEPSAQQSSVSLVDIASADGELGLGPAVQLAGYVPNAASMDVYGGVVRVLSIGRGSSWENHLQTFGVSERTRLMPVGHCQFGAGESLHSAEFAGSRALFVTDDPNAPLHAFTLDADGGCQLHAGYGLVPGGNDAFHFAAGGNRLIGVGSSAGAMAVTLYDSSDLSEASPMLAHVEVQRPAAWSEVSWDVEGFRVIGDAVGAPAAEAALETGMVLLPYAARDGDRHNLAGVQTVAFSDRTLSPHGVMEHGSLVKQSVALSPSTTLNLSDSGLTLFDQQDPASCREVGRLELAPNYSRVFVYGEHLVRVHLGSDQPDLGDPGSQSVAVEIVARSSDPETRAPIASFQVPASADLYQVGSLLVGVTLTGVAIEASSAGAQPVGTPSAREAEAVAAEVEVFDLGDPAAPRQTATLHVELPLRDFQGSYGYGAEPNSAGLARRNALVLPRALVLPSAEHHEEPRGSRQICITTPDTGCQQVERDGAFVKRCFSGQSECVRLDEDPARCLGEIRECDASFGDCGPAQDYVPGSQTCTREYLQARWTTLSFHIIDLSDPEQPILHRLEMPEAEQGIDVFAEGGSLYYTFKEPVELPDDPRSYAAYYYQRIDLEQPGAPQLAAAINVPGELIALDGSNLYARDYAWMPDLESGHEITLRRLTLPLARGAERPMDEALLEDSVSLGECELSNLGPDGGGSLAYVLRGKALVIADRNTLLAQSQLELTPSQRLRALQPGRALLSDGASIAIVDFANPAAASLTAHHLVRGWNSAMAWTNDQVLVAAGPYGLQRFPVAER